MKIAVNASILDAKPTGLGNVAINIVNHFSNKSNKTVYTSVPELISKEFNIALIPSNVQPTFNKYAGFYRFLWNQIKLTQVGKKFDLVYCPTHHGSFFLKNQVVTIHDLIVYRFPKIHRMQWLYYKITMPIFIKKSKAIIVISESVKQDIQQFYPHCDENKIFVIKNGYDKQLYNLDKLDDVSSMFENRLLLDSNFFISVGVTYEHKNIGIILELMQSKKANNSLDFKLFIVGGQSYYRSELEQRVTDYNLINDVLFLGYVTNDELVALYKNSLGLIYPSLYEGFGLPLIEAIACGCPVIASDISVFREVCDDTVTYFDPYNVDSLSDAINLLRSYDSETLSLINQKGLEKIKEYSWENSSRNISELLEKIIK